MEGTPIVMGTISSVRYNGSQTCPGTAGVPQPSAADCQVEGSLDNLLPNARLYALAEGRLGNRGNGVTHELDITSFGGTVSPTADFVWLSGVGYQFSVSFNPATQGVEYKMGIGTAAERTLTQTFAYSPARMVDALFLRTTSLIEGASVTLSNLSIATGGGAAQSLGGAQSSAPYQAPGYVQYLHIAGIDPGQSFTLYGTTTWIYGTVPSNANSRLAFQIKLGDDNPDALPSYDAPETGSFALLGSGLVGLVYLRRRLRR